MKLEIMTSIDLEDFLHAIEDSCGEGSYQRLAEWILEKYDIFVEGLHLETIRDLATVFRKAVNDL